MASKRLAREFETAFGGEVFKIPAFSTGEAAQVLQIPLWRIQKFLDVESYALKASTKIGGRRAFCPADLCRIKIAAHLLLDGFSPNTVARALEYIEGEDLIQRINVEGSFERTAIGFKRREGKEEIDFVPAPRNCAINRNDDVYYVLDLERVLENVEKRINEALWKRTHS